MIVTVGGVPGDQVAAQITGATGGVFNRSVAGTQMNLNAVGSGKLEQIRFWVRASGWVKMPAGTYTATMIASVFGVAGAAAWTAAAGNLLAAATSLSVTQGGTTAVVIPFVVEADLDGDTTSGKLQGVFEAVQSNTLTARAAITNAPTAISFQTEPPLQFAAGVTLTNAQAGAVCNLGSFILGAD